MLPILGPSNPRDAFGLGAEWWAEPINRYLRGEDLDALVWSRSGTNAVDTRSRNIELFDNIERTSLDYYATIRSLYRQRRAAEIRNEKSETPKPGLSSGRSPDSAGAATE
jgi:phospholipid-binding lipoprotein MlaA